MSDHVVPFAAAKITQIREAAREKLSPVEFDMLNELLGQLAVKGMTPYLNTQLGRLMAKFNWQLEISKSPMYEAALVYCDAALSGHRLKLLCRANGLSDSGHKKELCGRLYRAQVDEVVEVMQPIIDEGVEVSYLKEDDTRTWHPDYIALLKTLKGKTLADFEFRKESHPALSTGFAFRGSKTNYYRAYLSGEIIAGQESLEGLKKHITELLNRSSRV